VHHVGVPHHSYSNQVRTSGPKPNTKIIGDSLGSDVLTENGYVKVAKTLQVSGYESIFAIGDIINWEEQKQAFKTEGHASVVVANILSLLNKPKTPGRPDDSKPLKLKEYKTGTEIMLVTNGKVSFDNFPPKQVRIDLSCMQGGGAMYIGILWGITFGNWAARMIKSKDVGLSMIIPKMTGA
jgi:apoptosis-inducing factor 2